jgi:hypothetical protein
MQNKYLLIPIADDHSASIAVDKKGRPLVTFLGTASFHGQLASRLGELTTVYVGKGIQPKAGPQTRRLASINYAADPDLCSGALDAAQIFATPLVTPCFNAPDRIRLTSRDQVADRLSAIHGLDVPRTIRFRPEQPADIAVAIEAAGLEYPVLVRIAGQHGGTDLVKLDSADSVSAINTIPWGGRTLYATEFRDFRDPDGLYRKLRIVVVGSRFFLRHCIVGQDWLLSAARRLHADTPEERELLQSFDDGLAPVLSERVSAIADALGLDYFGIDASLRPDGRLLIFEANANMNVLHNSAASPNMWDQPIERIGTALVELIADPSRWRAQSVAVSN